MGRDILVDHDRSVAVPLGGGGELGGSSGLVFPEGPLPDEDEFEGDWTEVVVEGSVGVEVLFDTAGRESFCVPYPDPDASPSRGAFHGEPLGLYLTVGKPVGVEVPMVNHPEML